MRKIIFELKGVDFSYLGKFPALRGIDLMIEQGQKIAIIGANGSGKSTLLHLLDGLIFADKGSVQFSGKELSESVFCDENSSRTFRRTVGLVFQNPDVQLFCPTVKDDILFGPLQLGMPHEEIKQRYEEMIALLKIEALVDRAPHQLSIGEKKKVAFASTLVSDPEVILLDEPTAGLDPETSRHIIDMIYHAHEKGKTVISSTHDLHVVADISDTLCVFGRDKRIIKCGKTSDILKDTELLQKHNLIHSHRHRHDKLWHEHSHGHSEEMDT